jgi:trans-aconitate 3-methyltransferase
LVDLGTGHGLVSRCMAHAFEKVVGVDPSPGMIHQAESATKKNEYPNLEFFQASAEALPFLDDRSVDMVVSGQAIHWFDISKFFDEMERVVRPGGTLSFWAYTDHVFHGHPRASAILYRTSYGVDEDSLGPYWQQPGRSKLQNYLRDIQPPASDWEVDRRECNLTQGRAISNHGSLVMEKRMTVAKNMAYIRTWSSYHGWQETHPGQLAKNKGGEGDVVDKMFEAIKQAEPDWWRDEGWWETEIDVQWGTVLVLARKKG